jgi:hypothetical protein
MPMRLQPHEWNSGEIAWLIDAVGNPEGIRAGFAWLKENPFKERHFKLIGRADHGFAKIQTLDEIITAAKGSAG